ncbi:RNA polymerase sigma factor [Chondrinema litorale]|uniref:RNA polymerase sigma factor n=1 Tax=Chondrinema litorale TaxID=2994555 RepID=UPI0025428F72|nr:DUF6596 domain-containing protein [Chondrinema litorale]UZR96619.1 RNA polymerase subunit sigma [Chondrinema litorale]
MEKEHSKELLPHLFRQEHAKMIAVLCSHFGLRHIELAEDFVSDTFLKASELWAIEGIPENPTAWLYTVAKNKTRDYFKHLSVFESKITHEFSTREITYFQEIEIDNSTITDSQLAMIFAVCNPINSKESQICLALQILCGFSVEEISNAFLVPKETIKKRLFRARKNLRIDQFKITQLDEKAILERYDVVLKTLYLLFNEGYYSKSGNHLIRKELCLEALRLALLLNQNTLTDSLQLNALIALMCFQSSRLEARTDQFGDSILYENQNRALWDKALIDKGNYFLVNACGNKDSEKVSKYHLEAGIAYWHTSNDKHKWQHILHFYNQLLVMEYSPAAALNRTFALAKVYGNKKAVEETSKLGLENNSYFHALCGYLYAEVDIAQAINHYTKSIELSNSESEKKTLKKEVERLMML